MNNTIKIARIILVIIMITILLSSAITFLSKKEIPPAPIQQHFSQDSTQYFNKQVIYKDFFTDSLTDGDI